MLTKEKVRASLGEMRRSGVGIVVIAALLVELFSIVQYAQFRRSVDISVAGRSRAELRARIETINHTLESAEATMQEHLYELEHRLGSADSMYAATGRMIAANPHIVGGCIAFIPDYYPGKGRLYEPYASKSGGVIRTEQIGGADHDYTANPAFQDVLSTGRPRWSDPYYYGPDSVRLTTYSYPLREGSGRIVAVCGLDIDLSWLGDTLNAHPLFPSSFGLMLTRDGRLVAGPGAGHPKRDDVGKIVSLIEGHPDEDIEALDVPAGPQVEFLDNDDGDRGYIYSAFLGRDPDWRLVQVNYHAAVYGPMRRLRLRQMFLILAGLAVLGFLIARFAAKAAQEHRLSLRQARLDSELSVAGRIQTAMLPKSFPDRTDVDIYGSLTPAREVGGDLFDFFIRDGRLFFCIGDVSGKGVPSAMVMSMVHSLFRMAASSGEAPGAILAALNGELCRDNPSGMFVTFFTGILDLATGELRYSNAGHDRPVVVTDAPALLAARANLPLGVFDDTVYAEEELLLPAGATLFLYTDGLTEARDIQGRFFTRERMLEVLSAGVPSARELLSAMDVAVHRFMGDCPQSDDLTLLAIRIKS